MKIETKRKPLSKKLRFEVFKRDLFSCQYCGAKAPEAILEVDHIHPVFEGGTNDIENLITSCKACNRGKGKRKLNDESEVEKSRRQIEELQERKNMIDMILQWKASLRDHESYAVQKLEDIFYEHVHYRFTNHLKNRVRKSLKRYGLDIVLDALYIAIDTYIDPTKVDDTAYKALDKWLGIANNTFLEMKTPKAASLTKIKNFTCKIYGISAQSFYDHFPKVAYHESDEEEILQIMKQKHYVSHFWEALRDYYGE